MFISFLYFSISGIAFFSACFFNESQGYFTLGAGLTILFYLINMLANMGGNLEKFKYAAVFTLFSGDKIISGASGVFSSNAILAIIK